MSFVRLLLDGESNDDASQEQSNDEQLVLSNFSIEKRIKMLLKSQIEPLIKPVLEDIIHGLVKDGTELATKGLWTSMNRNSEDKIQPRNLKLKFVNQIPGVIFTGKKIVGEIALVDSLTGQVVKSGPVASAKVEIVVLEGDFRGTNGDDWTLEEFDSKIVKEMHGRKSLLVRNELNLKEGIGLVSEVSFTHNSSYVKNSEYMLGAKVVGHFDGVKVKEAKTEPFTLKDFRGTYREKHDSLSLHDEVWRVKGIAKYGRFCKCLIKAKVETVQDFLVQLSIDPQGLEQMHNQGCKRWKKIVDHAKQADVHMSVASAFKHWKDVDHFDDGTALNVPKNPNPLNSTALESPSVYNASNPKTVDCDVDAPVTTSYPVSSMDGMPISLVDFGEDPGFDENLAFDVMNMLDAEESHANQKGDASEVLVFHVSDKMTMLSAEKPHAKQKGDAGKKAMKRWKGVSGVWSSIMLLTRKRIVATEEIHVWKKMKHC